MKITKTQLKQIIKEEMETLKEGEDERFAEGDYIEIGIRDYGETSIELVDPKEYVNEIEGMYAPKQKMLVQVIQVAPDPYAD